MWHIINRAIFALRSVLMCSYRHTAMLQQIQWLLRRAIMYSTIREWAGVLVSNGVGLVQMLLRCECVVRICTALDICLKTLLGNSALCAVEAPVSTSHIRDHLYGRRCYRMRLVSLVEVLRPEGKGKRGFALDDPFLKNVTTEGRW